MEGAFEVIKDLLGGLSWDRESVYARLSQCIDSAIRSSLVIVLYKEGKEELIFANDMFYENIGEDRDGYEYKEADIKKRIKPENKVVKYEKCVEKSMLTGETQEIIYQFERYDGKVIWVRKRFAAICNEGEYIIVSVATNITKSIEISRQIEIENLYRAIARLPDKQRRRLTLYYFGEFTYEQIAEMEGCAFQVIARSIKAAEKNLKKFLTEG